MDKLTDKVFEHPFITMFLISSISSGIAGIVSAFKGNSNESGIHIRLDKGDNEESK